MAEAAEPMPEEPHSREDYIRLAKKADEDENYEEMVDRMKQVACMQDVKMTVEERSLLAVGYKNVVGTRRASWRIISTIEEKEERRGDQEKLEMIRTYKNQVIKELNDICNDIFRLLDKTLIPAAQKADDMESKVFYHKMQGDYNRYMAEWHVEDDIKQTYKSTSKSAYEKATDLAKTNLPPTHPVRLGVVLCYSMYINEVEEKYEEAFKLGLAAFEEAIIDLDTLEEDVYRDATHIMQMLRDNLVQWKKEARDRGQPFKEEDASSDEEFDEFTVSESSSSSDSSKGSSSSDSSMSSLELD